MAVACGHSTMTPMVMTAADLASVLANSTSPCLPKMRPSPVNGLSLLHLGVTRAQAMVGIPCENPTSRPKPNSTASTGPIAISSSPAIWMAKRLASSGSSRIWSALPQMRTAMRASAVSAPSPSDPSTMNMAPNMIAWRISGAVGTSPFLRASSSRLAVGSWVFWSLSASAMGQAKPLFIHSANDAEKAVRIAPMVTASSAMPIRMLSGWAMKKIWIAGASRADRPSATLNTMP